MQPAFVGCSQRVRTCKGDARRMNGENFDVFSTARTKRAEPTATGSTWLAADCRRCREIFHAMPCLTSKMRTRGSRTLDLDVSADCVSCIAGERDLQRSAIDLDVDAARHRPRPARAFAALPPDAADATRARSICAPVGDHEQHIVPSQETVVRRERNLRHDRRAAPMAIAPRGSAGSNDSGWSAQRSRRDLLRLI